MIALFNAWNAKPELIRVVTWQRLLIVNETNCTICNSNVVNSILFLYFHHAY